MPRPRTLLFLGALAILLSLGCARSTPRQTPYMRSVGNISVSAEELRVRTLGLAHLFMSAVEAAGNEIRDATDDPRIEQNALLWKIQSVPAVQEAAFNAEPLAALFDLWALAQQMSDYMTGPGGEAAFADTAPIAIEASAFLLEEIRAIVAGIGTDEQLRTGEQRIREWAAEHPIDSRYLVRTSIIQDMAQLSASYRRSGGLDAVGSFDERVRVFLDRLPFYTEYLPKQVVWQTELALTQNAERIRRETGLVELEHLRRLEDIDARLAEVADLTQTIEPLVERQRAAILEDVDAQRQAITADLETIVDHQIADLAAHITAEREAIMRDVSALIEKERTAALADVERQRLETLEEVRLERETILTEARSIADSTVGLSLDRVEAFVDRVLLRVAIFVVALGVLGLLAAIALRAIWVRPRPAAS